MLLDLWPQIHRQHFPPSTGGGVLRTRRRTATHTHVPSVHSETLRSRTRSDAVLGLAEASRSSVTDTAHTSSAVSDALGADLSALVTSTLWIDKPAGSATSTSATTATAALIDPAEEDELVLLLLDLPT